MLVAASPVLPGVRWNTDDCSPTNTFWLFDMYQLSFDLAVYSFKPIIHVRSVESGIVVSLLYLLATNDVVKNNFGRSSLIHLAVPLTLSALFSKKEVNFCLSELM